ERPHPDARHRPAAVLHTGERVLEPDHGGIARGQRPDRRRVPAAAAQLRRGADSGSGQMTDAATLPLWLGANFWSRAGGPRMWTDRYDPAVVRDELAVLAAH